MVRTQPRTEPRIKLIAAAEPPPPPGSHTTGDSLRLEEASPAFAYDTRQRAPTSRGEPEPEALPIAHTDVEREVRPKWLMENALKVFRLCADDDAQLTKSEAEEVIKLLGRYVEVSRQDPHGCNFDEGLDGALRWTRPNFESWFRSLSAEAQEQSVKYSDMEQPGRYTESTRHHGRRRAGQRGSDEGDLQRKLQQGISNLGHDIRKDLKEHVPGFVVVDAAMQGLASVGKDGLEAGMSQGRRLWRQLCALVSFRWAGDFVAWLKEAVEPDENVASADWWKIFVLQLLTFAIPPLIVWEGVHKRYATEIKGALVARATGGDGADGAHGGGRPASCGDWAWNHPERAALVLEQFLFRSLLCTNVAVAVLYEMNLMPSFVDSEIGFNFILWFMLAVMTANREASRGPGDYHAGTQGSGFIHLLRRISKGIVQNIRANTKTSNDSHEGTQHFFSLAEMVRIERVANQRMTLTKYRYNELKEVPIESPHFDSFRDSELKENFAAFLKDTNWRFYDELVVALCPHVPWFENAFRRLAQPKAGDPANTTYGTRLKWMQTLDGRYAMCLLRMKQADIAYLRSTGKVEEATTKERRLRRLETSQADILKAEILLRELSRLGRAKTTTWSRAAFFLLLSVCSVAVSVALSGPPVLLSKDDHILFVDDLFDCQIHCATFRVFGTLCFIVFLGMSFDKLTAKQTKRCWCCKGPPRLDKHHKKKKEVEDFLKKVSERHERNTIPGYALMPCDSPAKPAAKSDERGWDLQRARGYLGIEDCSDPGHFGYWADDKADDKADEPDEGHTSGGVWRFRQGDKGQTVPSNNPGCRRRRANVYSLLELHRLSSTSGESKSGSSKCVNFDPDDKTADRHVKTLRGYGAIPNSVAGAQPDTSQQDSDQGLGRQSTLAAARKVSVYTVLADEEDSLPLALQMEGAKLRLATWIDAQKEIIDHQFKRMMTKLKREKEAAIKDSRRLYHATPPVPHETSVHKTSHSSLNPQTIKASLVADGVVHLSRAYAEQWSSTLRPWILLLSIICALSPLIHNYFLGCHEYLVSSECNAASWNVTRDLLLSNTTIADCKQAGWQSCAQEENRSWSQDAQPLSYPSKCACVLAEDCSENTCSAVQELIPVSAAGAVWNSSDYLTVNGQPYHISGSGPSRVLVPTNGLITWTTDGSVSADGFILCGVPPGSELKPEPKPAPEPEPEPEDSMSMQSFSPFNVSSGRQHCYVDNRGCVTDGWGSYGFNEKCTIQVTSDTVVTATQYATESRDEFVKLVDTTFAFETETCTELDYNQEFVTCNHTRACHLTSYFYSCEPTNFEIGWHICSGFVGMCLVYTIFERILCVFEGFLMRDRFMDYFSQLCPWPGMRTHLKWPDYGLLPSFQLHSDNNIIAWNKLRIYLQTYEKDKFGREQLVVFYVLFATILGVIVKVVGIITGSAFRALDKDPEIVDTLAIKIVILQLMALLSIGAILFVGLLTGRLQENGLRHILLLRKAQLFDVSGLYFSGTARWGLLVSRDATYQDLKQQIEKKVGIPVAHQQLIQAPKRTRPRHGGSGSSGSRGGSDIETLHCVGEGDIERQHELKSRRRERKTFEEMREKLVRRKVQLAEVGRNLTREDSHAQVQLKWLQDYFRNDDRKEWVSDLVKLKERLTSKIQKLQKRNKKLVEDATQVHLSRPHALDPDMLIELLKESLREENERLEWVKQLLPSSESSDSGGFSGHHTTTKERSMKSPRLRTSSDRQNGDGADSGRLLATVAEDESSLHAASDECDGFYKYHLHVISTASGIPDLTENSLRL
jgi:hypothetical protein